MNDGKFLRDVIKTIVFLGLIVVLCRLTKGWGAVAVAFAGGCFAVQGKTDKFLSCYLLLPFMIMMNPLLLGAEGSFYVLVRIGNFILIAAALLRGLTGGNHSSVRLPIGLLFAYLGVAGLSSATGWFPLISYLKLVNFVLFLVGLCLAVGDLQSSDRALYHVRVIFMSFAVVVIIGSLALLPLPGIAYLTSARGMLREGATIADMNAAMAARTGVKLFAGVTNHSQCLGPMSVGLTGWVLCDMLFVVRRFSRLHMAVVALSPVVFFLTRSRTAMVSFVMVLFILFFYALGKVRMSLRAKSRVRQIFIGFFVLLVLGAVAAEVKSQTITRWLRKSEDVAGDERGLMEAVTSSRMEKVEGLMRDFHRNPLMGMGFQVSEDLPERYQMGQASLLSASVEKGNMFLTVLSETGIVGSVVFLAFLIQFYTTCMRRRHMALLTLFTYLLAANMGEATFFSPTALGGILWMLVAIGGLAVDISSKRRTEWEMMTGFRG